MSGQFARSSRALARFSLSGAGAAALAITPLMQAFAGQIETHLGLAVVEADVEPAMGLRRIDHRPLAALLPKMIDNRILAFERREMSVLQSGAGTRKLDRE